MGGRLGQIWLPCRPLIPRVLPPSVCPISPEITFQLSHLTVTAQTGAWFNFLFFSGLPGIWDFTFLTKNGTLPSFIGSVESSPLDHQGSSGAFIWVALQALLQGAAWAPPSPGGMPRLPQDTSPKLKTPIKTTQVALPLDKYLPFDYCSGWPVHSWRRVKIFFQINKQQI